MNILIVNQPLNNRGDESAHRALVRSILKYIPNSKVRVLWRGANQASIDQFEVTSPRTEYVNLYHKHTLKSYAFIKYGIKHPILWRIHPYVTEYLKYYRWADAVVCAPGGICMGGFMDWGHEYALLTAMKLHKPIFYYGRSIGPFWDKPKEKKLFKKQAIDILNYANYVSLRESESIRIAHDLGIKNVVQTVDTAFLDYPKVEIPQEIQSKIGNSRYVVFVPNLLIWHYYYKDKASKEQVVDFWSKIVDVITKHYPEHKIVMLPQTFKYGTYDGDDINMFKDIEVNRSHSNLIVVDDQRSSDIQQTIIRNADAMFGARYHSVVFAINNNVPFVAFNYEHKISGLLEELHLKDEMIDIKNLFSSSDLNQHVIETFDALIPNIHRSPEAQEKAKAIAKAAFDKFAEKMNNV
jgi:colanic acid/amylovoran biosynthesis protein